MAEIYDGLDNKRRANRLRKKAAILFKQFNEAFWDERSSFYAYALDGDKKKVLSVTSNGAVPLVRHHRARMCRYRRETVDAKGHVERLGNPHAIIGPSLVQSVQLSNRRGVAA